MRYSYLEDAPAITQKELYEQNGIYHDMTHVTMHDFKKDEDSKPIKDIYVGFHLFKPIEFDTPILKEGEDPLDFNVRFMITRNFKWKSYCNYIGLTQDNVF